MKRPASTTLFVLLLLALGAGAFLFGRNYHVKRRLAKAPAASSSSLEHGDLAGSIAQQPAQRLQVPRFVTFENSAGNPLSPDYDPSSLVQRGERLSALFDREPRDEAWASAVEKAALPAMSADLGSVIPGVNDVAIECRTATCKLSWTTPGEPTRDMDARVNAVLTQVYGGSALSRIVHNTAFLAYAGGNTPYAGLKGQASETVALLLTNREHRLKRLRSGTVPELLTKPVQPDEWPEP